MTFKHFQRTFLNVTEKPYGSKDVIWMDAEDGIQHKVAFLVAAIKITKYNT